MCKLPVGFLSETISHDDNFQHMVAIFTSLLPPMKFWWHNTYLLYFWGKLVSISKKFGKLLKKAHNNMYLHSMAIKWRRLLRRPFQNDKDFIDSLCQKFPTLAQGTFDNEALKFSDIERWNLESSFFESPYFLAFMFCDFRAKQ